MKTLKHHWIARPLSLILTILNINLATAFFSFALMACIGAPARAQGTSGRAPLTAVLDFQNDTGYGGADVGRTAADALVVELSNSDKYNNQVLTRGEVTTGLSQLGIAPPLDAIDLQRLGKKINAANVATGEVLAITRRDKPRQVEAVVVVRITDTDTGELVNGALARGLSNPRNGNGGDDDTLVNEAISKAMYAAAHQISTYSLPTATILNNEGPDSVLINKGARGGISSGLNMVVTRDGTRVGAIRVGAVAADDSTAGVTDIGIGIRPGDVAKAVFALPSYQLRGSKVITDSDISQGAAVTPTHKNAIAGVGGVILALLAAALLVALVNRGGNNGVIGGGNISNVTAQSVYGNVVGGLPYVYTALIEVFGNGSTTTTTSTSTSTSTSGTTAGFIPIFNEEINPTSYGARLSWGTGNINPTDIVGFNIYRDNFTPFNTFVSSTSGSTSGGTTTTTTTGNINLFATGPVISVGKTSRSVVDTGQLRNVSFPYIVQGGGGSSTSTSGSSSTSTSSTSTSTSGTTSGLNTGSLGSGALLNAPGPSLGASTNYEVTAVYLYRLPAGSSTTSTSGTSTTGSSTTSGSSGTAYEETALQTGGAGQVTMVVPPDIVPGSLSGGQFANGSSSNPVNINGTPGYRLANVPLSSVTFSFASTPGADTYILDVSSDQRFVHKKVVGPVSAVQANVSDTPGTTAGIGFDSQNVIGVPVNFQNVNLKTLFPGAATIYYRVGVKNSGDSPGPYNNSAVNPNPDLGPANSSYAYSQVGYFTGI